MKMNMSRGWLLHKRTWTLTAFLSLTVTLGGAQPLPAAPIEQASSDKIHTLAGVTMLSADGTRVAPVHIPKPATIRTPFGESPDVRVKGAEGFAGFALVSMTRPLAIIGGRLPTSEGHHFALPVSNPPDRSGWNFDFVKNYPDTVTIPPGRYRLYVFTDDEEVTIWLSLEGLKGRTVVDPGQPAAIDLSSPPPRLIGGGGATTNVYSAGESAELTSKGLIFSALWLSHEGFVSGQFDFCHYEGATEIEPVAYGPGCPNSTQHGFTNNRLSEMDAGSKILMIGKSGLEPRRHGQGFWFSAEGVITDVDYVSLWLPYGRRASP